MFEWYQYLPSLIDPVAFHLGHVAVRWYGLLYLGAFAACGLALWQLTKRERSDVSGEHIADMCLWMFWGAVIGGRLGFVFFYGWSFFVSHPWAIVWPNNGQDGSWIGWAGMSYFGGLIGVVVGLVWFTRRRGLLLWEWADRVALVAPLGYFLGRVANFINGELYGRVTEKPWGMYFPNDPSGGTMLRHPSQLYEAFGEGVGLFLLLWWLRKRFAQPGQRAAFSLAGYASIRFILEYFREPDLHIGMLSGLTLGQWLSMVAVFVSVLLFQWLKKKKCVKMDEQR